MAINENNNQFDEGSIEEDIKALERAEEMEDEMDEAEIRKEEMEDAESFNEIGSRSTDNGLYKLFDEIRKSDNSVKVSNLQMTELGTPIVSVRDCLFLSHLGEMNGHYGWAEFWLRQAEITNSTAMSKKGWFSELLVSNKRTTHKTSNPGFNPVIPSKKKWSLFGGGSQINNNNPNGGENQ